MRVWIYPEKQWGTFGAERFEVSTHIVRPAALGKEDIDIDSDISEHAWAFSSEEQARAHAKTLFERKDLAFGSVYLQKQHVDWFVERDRIAEWSNVGDAEELTAEDCR